MIYFDNAATTGMKPPAVIRAVNTALTEYCANPGRSGHRRSENTAGAIYSAREKTAAFFGASGAEKVAFTENCTHSINCVIKGVLRPGDHVVTSSLEHNAVMRPLEKTGISYDMAEVSLTDDGATLEEFRKKIKDNTRLVICTGASNVLGKILPIADIGRLCRERGILFALDAAQVAGVININMAEMNIDYLCIAPHKGLYAPMGIGILICEKPLYNTIIEGGTGTESASFVQPDALPEQIESGTVNVPGILGTAAGLDFIAAKGVDAVYAHEMQLCAQLYEGLSKIRGAVLYTPHPMKNGYAPVLSFNMDNITSGELAQLLDKNGIAVRAGLHCAPTAHRAIGTLNTGTVRVAPAVFNTAKEVQYMLNFLKAYSVARSV